MDFLLVIAVENIKSVSILRAVTGLDEGESEAIIMYDEQNADLLLMDEHKGRQVAKQLGVRHIGTAGILMLAYDKNLIQAEQVPQNLRFCKNFREKCKEIPWNAFLSFCYDDVTKIM